MNKKKIIIGIFSVAVFIGIYTNACIYQSRKYPDPVFESVEAGEEITFDEYKSQNGYIQVFSDSRFTQENSDPTMKREISNDDVTFPVLEDKTNNNDD